MKNLLKNSKQFLKIAIFLTILTVAMIIFYQQIFVVKDNDFFQSPNQKTEILLTDINHQEIINTASSFEELFGLPAANASTEGSGGSLNAMTDIEVTPNIKPSKQSEPEIPTIINGPADNGYFRAQVGTYWVYEGNGSEMFDGENVNNYKIKMKNEVVSMSEAKDGYLLKIKTTNLIDMSTEDSTITLGKDYIIFDVVGFYNYVRFPLKVGNRWPEYLDPNDTEPLREDGYYQNRIDWKLNSRILGNDCYNIIYQTLPDTSQTIWCDLIGPIQSTYHHNGTLDDSSIRLTEYHF